MGKSSKFKEFRKESKILPQTISKRVLGSQGHRYAIEVPTNHYSIMKKVYYEAGVKGVIYYQQQVRQRAIA